MFVFGDGDERDFSNAWNSSSSLYSDGEELCRRPIER